MGGLLHLLRPRYGIGVVWVAWVLLVATLHVQETEALFEEVEVDPSNTNGMELGEISFLQFILGAIIFLKLVALYAGGVLPIEIDLGGKFDSDYYDDYYYDDYGDDDYFGKRRRDGYDYYQLQRRRQRQPRKLSPNVSLNEFVCMYRSCCV